MTFSRRSRFMRGLESELPAFEMVGSVSVCTWKSILLRAKALYASNSVVGGVDLVFVITPGRPGYSGTSQALRSAGASAHHAMVASDLREELMVARAYLHGQFQRGVISRGADGVCSWRCTCRKFG